MSFPLAAAKRILRGENHRHRIPQTVWYKLIQTDLNHANAQRYSYRLEDTKFGVKKGGRSRDPSPKDIPVERGCVEAQLRLYLYSIEGQAQLRSRRPSDGFAFRQ